MPEGGVGQGVMRAFDGDVEGGAIDAGVAAASCYLMTAIPFWGPVAAVALTIANALFNTSDPPEGHADFSIENGVVDFHVGGDSSMEGRTSEMAEFIRGSMQSYLNGGGRIELAGEKMPKLSIEEGSPPRLDYGSTDGGNIGVFLDGDNLAGSLLSVFTARDRGEDLSMAIDQAQLAGGGIDFARVDAIMAGLGYARDGINYVYGERTEVQLSTVGTGVFAGGHNVSGPEGEVLTARQSDIISHPLREEQLPQRTMGKVIENIDVGNNLLGAGSSLFAAALMGVGLTGNQADAGEVSSPVPHIEEGSLPLDAVTAAAYLRGEWFPADAGAEQDGSATASTAAWLEKESSAPELAAFINGEWGEVNFYGVPTGGSAVYTAAANTTVAAAAADPAAAVAGGDIATISLHHILWGSPEDGGRRTAVLSAPGAESSAAEETPSAASALWGQGTVERGVQPDEPPLPELPPEIARGAVFHTVTDGSLRFLADQLVAPVGTVTLTSEVGRFVGFGAVEHGRLSIDENGHCRFLPDEDFTGYASFRYFLEYQNGERQELEAGVYVGSQNHAPQVVDDEISLQQGELFFLDQLLANDSDIDGDSLHLLRFSTPAHGSFTTVDGRAVFVAEKDFYGTEDFTYWVGEEGAGGDAWPVAGHAVLNYAYKSVGDDNFHTDEDSELKLDIETLLDNDRDQCGERVAFADLGDAVNGTVRLDGESVLFTPKADYAGDNAGFSYSVTAADGVVTTGFVSVAVRGVNDAPTVAVDSLEIPADQPLVFDEATLSALFTDIDGDTLAIKEISASEGTITREDGLYTLTPEEGFRGETELDLVVVDAGGEEVSSTVVLQTVAADVQPSETADSQPVDEQRAEDSSAVEPSSAESMAAGVSTVYSADVLEDSTITLGLDSVLAEAFGEDEPPVFAGVREAAHGSVQIDDGEIIFTPDADYSGDDAGFMLEVKRGEETEQGWVEVAVEDVADAMEVIGDRLLLGEDQSIVFNEQLVSSLLRDADGTGITLQEVTTTSSHGEIVTEDGLFCFLPEENWYGAAEFDYTAVAADGEELSGHLYASFAPANDRPEAEIYTYGDGVEDEEVQISVSDLMAGAHDVEDGDNVVFGGIYSVVNGTAWVDDNDIIHLRPHDDFYGTAGLGYTITDSEGGVGHGYGKFDFAEVNDTPVAVNNHLRAWSNNSYENIYDSRELLKNDVDVDGDRLEVISVGEAEHGTVFLDEKGMIHYTGTEKNWVGSDSFTYTIADGRGGESEAVVNVEVGLNSSPTLSSEVLKSLEDNVLLLDQNALLQNDSDIDGDRLWITEIGDCRHCEVSLLEDGSIQVIPEYNYNTLYVKEHGNVTFEYTVSDGISDAVSAVAVLDLEPVNDAPVAADITLTGAIEDNAYAFSPEQLMAGCFDIEAASAAEEDQILFQGITGVTNGRIEYVAETGKFVYHPDADFFGRAAISFEISDTHGAKQVGTTCIDVAGVNDAPVVEYDRNSGRAEDSIWNKIDIGRLLANDHDADGDRLHAENFHITGGRGDLQVHGSSLWVKPAFHQRHLEIGYDVVDGHGGSTPGRLSITNIHEHNFAPRFTGLHSITWEGRNTVWFNFHAEDRNGGNTWAADPSSGKPNKTGDIAGIAISHLTSPAHCSPHRGVNPFFFKVENAVGSSFMLTVTDMHGASSTMAVHIDGNRNFHYNLRHTPVVIDLDRDGVELVDISAGVRFDWNCDGTSERSGWTNGDDAFLVYDYDSDGLVTKTDELSFLRYKEGAVTDLEGLQGFDSNDDGVFSAADAEWEKFALWQDKNSNGVTDEGELTSMADSELESIGLQSDGESDTVESNVVFGTAAATTTDGEVLEVGDVALVGEELEMVADSSLESFAASDEEGSDEVAPDVATADIDDPSASADLATESVACSDTEIELDVEGVDSAEESEQTTADASSATDSDLPFDDSTLNNLVDQLVSDMAAGLTGETAAADTAVLESVAVIDAADSSLYEKNDIGEENIFAIG